LLGTLELEEGGRKNTIYLSFQLYKKNMEKNAEGGGGGGGGESAEREKKNNHGKNRERES
jgi:hypothetical protein